MRSWVDAILGTKASNEMKRQSLLEADVVPFQAKAVTRPLNEVPSTTRTIGNTFTGSSTTRQKREPQLMYGIEDPTLLRTVALPVGVQIPVVISKLIAFCDERGMCHLCSNTVVLSLYDIVQLPPPDKQDETLLKMLNETDNVDKFLVKIKDTAVVVKLFINYLTNYLSEPVMTKELSKKVITEYGTWNEFT